MLKVEHFEIIRRKVLVEGMSQREVAEELGHSRKTVAKAVKYPSPPPFQRSKDRPHPVLGPFQALIHAWLEADQSAPRKQRHKASRIYDLLKCDHGFQGHQSTVRRYVASLKATEGERFFPLQFDPGQEAQVDWGEATVIENGVERKTNLFCMRLCYSTASFVCAYERQTMESLLDAHVRAFEFFGGISRRLAYDNMKTVVITVGRGQERKLNVRFVELKSHYLFETRFCNVACGNEKGHVENLVKFAQQHFVTPLPRVCDLEELNTHLLNACRQDLDRPHARSGRTRRELLAEEQAKMLPLQEPRFEACAQRSGLVSKFSLVRHDNADYSVPVAYAYHACVLKAFVERVEIFVNHERVASHKRSHESGAFIIDPLHFIPLLERKPGALDNARPFKGEPWGEEFTVMRKELEYRYGGDGTRKYIRILLLFSEFPEAQVKDAVRNCLKRAAFNDDAVKSVLNYEPPKRIGSLDLSQKPELLCEENGIQPASAYECLREEGLPCDVSAGALAAAEASAKQEVLS